MTRRTGLILDFGGVLTTGVAECALAFDRRTGLPDGTFLSVIARDPEGAALYADLERGAITQVQWNERTAALLGIDHPAGLSPSTSPPRWNGPLPARTPRRPDAHLLYRTPSTRPCGRVPLA